MNLIIRKRELENSREEFFLVSEFLPNLYPASISRPGRSPVAKGGDNWYQIRAYPRRASPSVEAAANKQSGKFAAARVVQLGLGVKFREPRQI
jgi:hypothetical protein